MCKYRLVDLYARTRAQQVSSSTVEQNVEKLVRVLDQLCANYGVEVEDKRIVGLDGITFTEWYGAFVEGRTISTVNNYICTLNPFFRWAHKAGVLEADLEGMFTTNRLPDLDELPEDERPKDKYLTHEQAAELLKCEHGRNHVRDRAIIALFLYAGLRTTELCSLTIGSVYNQPKGTIHCKRKGGRYCDVQVAEDVYPYLEAYLANRADRENMDAPLFMTTHGQPCNRIQIYKALSYKQKQLDLATGGHSLRHTFVSEMEKIGGAAVARDAANHKSMRITNRYAHSQPEQIHDAVNQLNW